MNNVLPEIYSSETLCGQRLILEVFGEPDSVAKMTLGNRFFYSVKCYPANSGNQDLVNWFFDYYKNYACLLDWEDLKKGWRCYQKARKQSYDSTPSAFWNYFDGKSIKVISRTKGFFEWV